MSGEHLCVFTLAFDSQLGDSLERSTLHIFVIQNSEDALRYLQSHAGKHCERQMLVADKDISEVRDAELDNMI